MSRFDYVTVGHVTVDVIGAEGTRRPGGGAFYSALQAARLGLRTLIVTKGVAQELEALLEPFGKELEVRVLPAQHTTTLATTGFGAQRKQRVLAWAGAITEPLDIDTSILHFAAVARETPHSWQGHAELIGITPQGLVRQWGESGEIALSSLEPSALPSRFDAAVLSESELACAQWLTAGSAKRPLVAVTAGARPTLLHLPDGSVLPVPVPPRDEHDEPRDDLGAGDVFAAAFFIALRDGRSAQDAAAYGNAAAAVRIAGSGAQAVGTAAAIAQALRR